MFSPTSFPEHLHSGTELTDDLHLYQTCRQLKCANKINRNQYAGHTSIKMIDILSEKRYGRPRKCDLYDWGGAVQIFPNKVSLPGSVKRHGTLSQRSLGHTARKISCICIWQEPSSQLNIPVQSLLLTRFSRFSVGLGSTLVLVSAQWLFQKHMSWYTGYL